MQKSVHTPEYRLLRARLRETRENAGLSQRELAARLRVPPSWVAKVEAGERRIDFVEFCWFAAACEADAAKLAAEVIAALGRSPSSNRRGRST
jgi:transcriptional regulator with XRE-family HTH domain